MLDEVRDQAALVSAVAWAADPPGSGGRRAPQDPRPGPRGDADGAARALHAHIASFVRRAFPEAEFEAEYPAAEDTRKDGQA